MNTPAEIMTALKTVLAGVANLSSSTVSVNDWSVQNNPYSVVIYEQGGTQQISAAGPMWTRTHRIVAKLCLKLQSLTLMYQQTTVMVPLILAALADNDALGLAVAGHLEPITWESANFKDDYGVVTRETDFVITYQTMN